MKLSKKFIIYLIPLIILGLVYGISAQQWGTGWGEFVSTSTTNTVSVSTDGTDLLVLTNTDATLAAETFILTLNHNEEYDATAYGDFIKCVEDADGTPGIMFRVEYDGDVISAGNIAGATYGSTGVISDAELLLINGITGFGASMIDDADEATFKATVNLEAGTDFYSIAAADAAFEAELNNSAGLLAALDDETGTGVAVFNIAPTFVTSITMGSAGLTEPELEILDGATLSTTEINYLDGATGVTGTGNTVRATAPTFVTSITMGAAVLSEAELEILDGATTTTAQLNYINTATGTTGTNTTNLVYSTSPTLVTPTLGAATATSITLDASATPGWVFRDSGNPGTDKEIAKISANFLSGGDGAEDGALYLWAMLGGSEVLWLAWDSDTEAITMGDSGTGEDLIWDFETATDNEVAVSTNSGTTQINFGTLNLLTTGTIQGAITINSDADGMTQANMTAVGMYGSAFFATGAGTWNLPAAAAGMSFILYSTGANAIIINPDDADTITYDGVMDTAGHQIASPSAAGDYIAMIALDAVNWYVLGHSGTWVPGA